MRGLASKHESQKTYARKRRQFRSRKKITGTADKPRLLVIRSSRHIRATIVDDFKGITLAQASTMEKDFAGTGSKVDKASEVGRILGVRAKEAGVASVVFDRGGRRYHGRVKALADAAREAGLEF